MRKFHKQNICSKHRSARYEIKSLDKETKSLPVLYHNKENCCGCSACYAICSIKAIKMEPDEEGFLYPSVNADRCIGCNLCLTVCAFKLAQKEKKYILE
jgi:formate hydrogenlyase subunit 6/NADH:ubiquinone oxidoreductase subunit I